MTVIGPGKVNIIIEESAGRDLAYKRDRKGEQTGLDLFTNLSNLLSVQRILIPSHIADWKWRGAVAELKGDEVELRVVHPEYQNGSRDLKFAEAGNLDGWLVGQASQIRLPKTSNQAVSVWGANKKLFIVDTPFQRDVNYDLAEMLLNPGASKGKKEFKIAQHDVSDYNLRIIEGLITALKIDTPCIIVTNDERFTLQRRKSELQTTPNGQPIITLEMYPFLVAALKATDSPEKMGDFVRSLVSRGLPRNRAQQMLRDSLHSVHNAHPNDVLNLLTGAPLSSTKSGQSISSTAEFLSGPYSLEQLQKVLDTKSDAESAKLSREEIIKLLKLKNFHIAYNEPKEVTELWVYDRFEQNIQVPIFKQGIVTTKELGFIVDGLAKVENLHKDIKPPIRANVAEKANGVVKTNPKAAKRGADGLKASLKENKERMRGMFIKDGQQLTVITIANELGEQADPITISRIVTSGPILPDRESRKVYGPQLKALLQRINPTVVEQFDTLFGEFGQISDKLQANNGHSGTKSAG